MDDSSQLKKGSTSFLILAVLSRCDMHGYAIAREIQQRSENALSMGEGALYPALRALEREGAVESRWEIQASGPARKIYSLTDHGKQKLKSRIADWNSFSSGIAAVLKGAPVYEFSV